MSNMNSDLFSIYLDQFNTCILRTNKLLESIKFKLKKEDYSKVVSEIEKNIKEAARIINQMNLDINLGGGRINIGVKQNKNIQNLNNCKKELDDLTRIFKKQQENYQLNKQEEELVIRVNPGNFAEYNNNLNKSSTNLSQDDDVTILSIGSRSNEKLNQILRTGVEIENVSENIKRELHGHSKQISGLNSKVQLLTGSIDQSNSIVRNMMIRGNRNKLVLAVFSFTLVCMFILILYTKN